MDRESTTHNLSSEKLARLWGIGSDVQAEPAEGDTDPDHLYVELLHDWMARQLPPDPVFQELLPGEWAQLCRELRPFSGCSIGLLLSDPHTDLPVFKAIKDRAKEMGATTTRGVEREAALTVYFAAIAGAMVFHGARISRHSDRTLRSAFMALSTRKGGPSELASLFERACRSVKSLSGSPREEGGSQ